MLIYSLSSKFREPSGWWLLKIMSAAIIEKILAEDPSVQIGRVISPQQNFLFPRTFGFIPFEGFILTCGIIRARIIS